MATKTAKKNKNLSTIEILKKQTSNFNKVALNTSNDIVEETLATGEQWQKLFAKTLRKGTTLFEKQQDMVLTGLEMLKDQYSYGNKRFRKLLNFKPTDSKTPKTTTKKSKAAAKTSKSIDQVMDATAKTENTVKKVAKQAKKPVAAKKATPAPKKPAAATKKPVPVTSTKINKAKLTVIEGIGPKIESLLKNAGITNLDKLAAATPSVLKDVLVSAGTRFQMHDPSTWAAQAKLAAADKMEELKVLQEELKGGK